MIGLSPYSDHIVKQEQYKDLLHQAGHYRLIKAAARPGLKSHQKAAGALRKLLIGLSQLLSGLWLISRARV